MKKGQNLAGLILIMLILIMGKTMLGSSMLFFRLLAGIGFGYALTRGFIGFAGSVNRGYKTGSTKLMRVLAYMFLGTSILSAAFLYNSDASSYDLWVKDAGIPTDWIRKSWFTSETGAKLYNGVYFPDLFKWDGLDGYLGAVLLTSFLCGVVVYISKKYESSRRVSGTFTGVSSEIEQVKIVTQDYLLHRGL